MSLQIIYIVFKPPFAHLILFDNNPVYRQTSLEGKGVIVCDIDCLILFRYTEFVTIELQFKINIGRYKYLSAMYFSCANWQ